MTACSFSSSKWAHYDDGTHAILRVSAGRVDDHRWTDLDPASLVAALAPSSPPPSGSGASRLCG
ncbi:MAG: hypothetical protein R2695_07790 [Acidimicrobiales bacterium]